MLPTLRIRGMTRDRCQVQLHAEVPEELENVGWMNREQKTKDSSRQMLVGSRAKIEVGEKVRWEMLVVVKVFDCLESW